MKWKDFETDYFTYIRKKTANTTKENGTPIVVPLNKITQSVISRWSGVNKKIPDSYVFNILSATDDWNKNPVVIDRKVENFIKVSNKWLKRLGDELGLSIPLTTYVARHSYATLLITHGGGSMELVGQSLGHTNIQTTQKYIGGFELGDLRKYADALLQLAEPEEK